MDQRKKNLSLLEQEKYLEDVDCNRGDVRLLLSYPNRYWVAMSNLGFQTIYKLFAQNPRIAIERSFYPDEGSSEFRSFETNQQLKSFDVLAMSMSFETDYLYALETLEKAGLNLADRDKLSWEAREEEYLSRPFMLAGGAALTLNSEPMANYFDAILIGEGEEFVTEFCTVYLNARDSGSSLRQTLQARSIDKHCHVCQDIRMGSRGVVGPIA